jgi:hypothetical protein
MEKMSNDVMQINKELIVSIFARRIKLTSPEDKQKLSTYEEYIPMYDIRTLTIYPVYKMNLYNRIHSNFYRIITLNVVSWLTNLLNKHKGTKLEEKFKYNLEILDNYIFDILTNTSYNALYKYSPQYGMSISICKKSSFDQRISTKNPYYTRLEIIKLGQNLRLIPSDIDSSKLDSKYLYDNDLQYSICKKVSLQDVKVIDIITHSNFITNDNIISWICFYSYYGSSIYNDQLRSDVVDEIYYPYLVGLSKLLNIKNIPKFTNDSYTFFRFVKSDTFIKTVEINEFFEDTGFMSCTRDPFYQPSITGVFGNTLIKIIIPREVSDNGLFIENYSLYKDEYEYLLFPNCVFQLLSKTSRSVQNYTRYFHINENIEKAIINVYEIKLISRNKTDFILPREPKYTFTDITKLHLTGNRENRLKQLIRNYSNYNSIPLSYNGNTYVFNYSSLEMNHLHYNRSNEGNILSCYNKDGYPILFIELGDELMINYISQYYFSNEFPLLTHNDLLFIYELAKLFRYDKALISHEYSSLVDTLKTPPYDSFILYNKTIYDYLKSKKRHYLESKYITYDISYDYLDLYFDKNIENYDLPTESLELFTMRELYIACVETSKFYLYNNLMDILDETIKNNQYVTYNIYKYASDNNDMYIYE